MIETIRFTLNHNPVKFTGDSERPGLPGWLIPVGGLAAAVVIATAFLLTLDDRREVIEESVAATVADTQPETLPEPLPENPPVAAVIEEPEPVAPETTQAEPEDPEVSLDAQLQLARELTTPETAMRTLLDLWGIEYQVGASGCQQAAAAGYECLFQRGSMTSLKQYDRPAVLTLIDGRGATHNVVLTAVRDSSVELSIGGVDVSHSLDELSDMWFGEYVLVWRPPNGTADALGPGSVGPGVAWLRQSLAAIDSRYSSAAPDSEIFDADLADKVRLFQRDNRLDVDGLAGRQTQIIINTLLEPDRAPRLTMPRLAQE